MNQDTFIPFSAVSQKWLEEKFRSLEEKISSIEPARKSIKDEWLILFSSLWRPLGLNLIILFPRWKLSQKRGGKNFYQSF
ncbi:MAG: hypothetical protein WD426_03455 [Anditalea sp.]